MKQNGTHEDKSIQKSRFKGTKFPSDVWPLAFLLYFKYNILESRKTTENVSSSKVQMSHYTNRMCVSADDNMTQLAIIWTKHNETAWLKNTGSWKFHGLTHSSAEQDRPRHNWTCHQMEIMTIALVHKPNVTSPAIKAKLPLQHGAVQQIMLRADILCQFSTHLGSTYSLYLISENYCDVTHTGCI